MARLTFSVARAQMKAIFLAVAFLGLAANAATAPELPELAPAVRSITPLGARPGESVEVQISGRPCREVACCKRRSTRTWCRVPAGDSSGNLGTVLGILLGAAVSNILAMATSGQYSAVGVLVSAGLAVVGAFSVAVHAARD